MLKLVLIYMRGAIASNELGRVSCRRGLIAMIFKGKSNSIKKQRLIESIYILVLLLYPLRHINFGLDLWDTGYNYANFTYIDRMDSMWFFATFLANQVGNLFTRLPGANTMLGMNFYTHILISIMAIGSYFFCSRELNYPKGLVFLGELVAISLCWCPPAVLYTYLTYVLYLIGIVLLYFGLTREKNFFLIGAGLFLGFNLFVRFPNLMEIALVLSVLGYHLFIEKQYHIKRSIQRALSSTMWCILGYTIGVFGVFLIIHFQYGIVEYFNGISRLFDMREGAETYQISNMILMTVNVYRDSLKWGACIALVMVCGMMFYLFADKLLPHFKNVKLMRRLTNALWIVGLFLMLIFLQREGFFGGWYDQYWAIYNVVSLFIFLTLITSLEGFFQKKRTEKERLWDCLIFLTIIIVPIGSNTETMPIIGFLYLVAPYMLCRIYKLLICPTIKIDRFSKISLFPMKSLVVMMTLLTLFQSIAFGVFFSYEEAKGVKNGSTYVYNNKIAKGIRMSPERAEQVTEISRYIEENNLKGQDVILFGEIPTLSYILELPFLFSPWIDLDSYNIKVLQGSIEEIQKQIETGERQYPLIIVNQDFFDRISDKQQEKWNLLEKFMVYNHYEKTFDKMYSVWRKVE